jgi:hypothetical protein
MCCIFLGKANGERYLQLFLTGTHWELLLDGPLPSKQPLLYVLNFNAHRKHLALAWTMSLDFELAIFHNCTFTQLDSFIHSCIIFKFLFVYFSDYCFVEQNLAAG